MGRDDTSFKMAEEWVHICEQNDHDQVISDQGKWFLRFQPGKLPSPISYCPYCGIKLEVPDVKIPASRNTLRNCVEQLWTVHGDIEGHATDAPERTFAVAQQLNKVLREAEAVEEPVSPDVKIEVSRKMLEEMAGKLRQAQLLIASHGSPRVHNDDVLEAAHNLISQILGELLNE